MQYVAQSQEGTSRAWLDHACVTTVDVLCDVTDERSDRRKHLKIAGGCTTICALDGASLRSRARMLRHSGLDHRDRSVRPRLTSDLMRLLRLSPVRMAHYDIAAWRAGRSIGVSAW